MGAVQLQVDATSRLIELSKHAEMQSLFEAEVERDEFNHAFHAVFNAAAVVVDVEERYGIALQGKELGAFMQKVRQHLAKTKIPSLADLRTAVDEACVEKMEA